MTQKRKTIANKLNCNFFRIHFVWALVDTNYVVIISWKPFKNAKRTVDE